MNFKKIIKSVFAFSAAISISFAPTFAIKVCDVPGIDNGKLVALQKNMEDFCKKMLSRGNKCDYVQKAYEVKFAEGVTPDENLTKQLIYKVWANGKIHSSQLPASYSSSKLDPTQLALDFKFMKKFDSESLKKYLQSIPQQSGMQVWSEYCSKNAINLHFTNTLLNLLNNYPPEDHAAVRESYIKAFNSQPEVSQLTSEDMNREKLNVLSDLLNKQIVTTNFDFFGNCLLGSVITFNMCTKLEIAPRYIIEDNDQYSRKHYSTVIADNNKNLYYVDYPRLLASVVYPEDYKDEYFIYPADVKMESANAFRVLV